jgi:hypothetical protein
MVPSFFDRQFHCHMSGALADVVVPFNDGSDFSFPDDPGPLTKFDGSVFDPREIGSNPSDAVAWIASQIGLDQKLGNELGVVRRHAAGCE